MKRVLSFGAALVLGLLLLLAATPRLYAETLHENSQRLLEARAAKADPQDYTFVVMGDSRDNDEVFGRILDLAKSFDPVFILHDGDIIHSGQREEFAAFRALIGQRLPDFPLFVCIGNHELTGKKDRQLYQEFIGPLDFNLDLPGLDLSLVALDNTRYELSREQLSYLKDKLAAPRRYKFTLMHAPPQTARWTEHVMIQSVNELYAVLAEQKVAAAFYGHIHLFDLDQLNGVSSLISGGAGAPLAFLGFGDPSYHIVVVRVKDGQVTWREVRLER